MYWLSISTPQHRRYHQLQKLLQKLAKQSSSRAIKELNKYTIVDDPNDENLDIHLITYDYHVQHNSFTLSRRRPTAASTRCNPS